MIYRTRFGLRLRAAGENPHALDTAGVSVANMRYLAMVIMRRPVRRAGAYLSIAHKRRLRARHDRRARAIWRWRR